MTEKLLKIAQRLIKWDTDFPVNCYNGYAGLKELDAIIADGKTAVADATGASVDELGEIEPKQSFQSRVRPWMLACFGAEISSDRVERCDRFIGEALELTQAIGYSPERAHALVDYVFGRPVGDPHQEVGGVMITLAAMCLTCGLDIDQAGEDELARIWTKVDAIRAKQAAKPVGSALPSASGTKKAAAQNLWPTPNEVADIVADGKGHWRSCTGCHELNDGHPTGPFSASLSCHIGIGCTECGGIGAVWDTTDYATMGEHLSRDAGGEQ